VCTTVTAAFAGRGTRLWRVDPHDEQAEVHRMQAVDILGRFDGPQRGRVVERLRQRNLHQEPVDSGIGVELADAREQLRHRDVGRVLAVERLDTDLRARQVLPAHVRNAARIVADQDRAETRHDARFAQRFDPGVEVDLHRLGEGGPVE